MADQPSRPDFQAAANEATAPQPTEEPIRPETVRSAVAGWAQSADMVSQERSAIEAVKIAAQMKEQRQPEQSVQPEVKQSERIEQTESEESRAKQALSEIARDLAPKENPIRDEQQQLQRGRDIER